MPGGGRWEASSDRDIVTLRKKMAGIWLLTVCSILTCVSIVSGKYAEGTIVSLKVSVALLKLLVFVSILKKGNLA